MRSDSAVGVLYAGGAFLFWGFAPIYWKTVREVSSIELLCHRVLWAAPLLIAYVLLRRRVGSFSAVLADRRTLAMLTASTVLIAANWLVFIVAVNTDNVLQASLGYYMNPLVNVLLGMIVLGERLCPGQWIAVGLAAVGVTIITTSHGHLPWIALALAVSFALYGLVRKTVRADGVTGLTFEVLALAPLAFGFLTLGVANGTSGFVAGSSGLRVLILCAGPITILPLVWFTNGARRIRLSTVGILQYLAPSGHFLLAVLVYREPLSSANLVAFVFIWAAITVYTVSRPTLRRA